MIVLVTPGTAALTSLALLAAVRLILGLRNQRLVKKLAAQLNAGEAIDRSAAYPRTGKLYVFACAAWILCLVLYTLFLLTKRSGDPFDPRQYQPLDQLHAFTPAALEIIEGPDFRSNDRMTTMASEVGKGELKLSSVSMYNYYNRSSPALLCWDQFNVRQTGQEYDDGITPQMRIEWYDPAIDAMAVPLARELLMAAEFLTDDYEPWWADEVDPAVGWTQEEFPLEGGWLAVLAQPGAASQAAAVALDGRAAVLLFRGHGDLREHLEKLTDMVRK